MILLTYVKKRDQTSEDLEKDQIFYDFTIEVDGVSSDHVLISTSMGLSHKARILNEYPPSLHTAMNSPLGVLHPSITHIIWAVGAFSRGFLKSLPYCVD